jgi:hypothetical protein
LKQGYFLEKEAMTATFKFCILFEEAPGRDLSQTAPGWDISVVSAARFGDSVTPLSWRTE